MGKVDKTIKNYGIKGLYIYVVLKLGISQRVFLPGVSYPIHLRRKTSDIPTFHQIFTSKEYEVSLDFYPETILDAGANIGLAAIYFANKYPQAKIICIEPEKSNYHMLEKNTIHYKNISSLKRAISNRSGNLLNVVDDGFGNWGFITKSKDTTQQDNIVDSVKTTSVGEIMKENRLAYIDLVKIDIEGAERELFKDNFEDWLPKTRCVIIELHDWMKEGSSKNFFKAISKYNFSYFQKGENLIFINTDENLKR